jgi:hypothetical protein
MGVTPRPDSRVLMLRVVWFSAQAIALLGGVDMAVSNGAAVRSEFLSATLLVLFAVTAQFATRLSWLTPMSPARAPAPSLPGSPPPGVYTPVKEVEHRAKLVGEVNGHAYLVAVCPECGSVNRWVRP